MLEPTRLSRRGAFDGISLFAGASEDAGVRVTPRPDLQIATVIAREGHEALASRLRTAYQLELLPGPRRMSTDRITLIGTGPRTWLAMREGGDPLYDELQREIGTVAAITDQSDAYAILRLSGNKVRATLEKGLSVDLHPRSFGTKSAAVTTCSHIGVVIWQLDDAPTYEVAVFRSFASGLWHWLSESAAEFGLELMPPERG